jgi:predicted RND superfamily exporter protein
MQPLLRRWAAFVVAHAWLVLAGALVASALVGAGALRLTANLDLEHQLPADNPYIALDRRLRAEFGGKNFVAIAVVPQQGTVWRRDVLQVVHDVTRELLDAPGVIRQNVASLSSPYVRVPRTRGDVLSVEYLMREVPRDDAGVAALRALYLGEPLFRGTVVSRDERAAMVLADFYDDTPTETIYRAIHAVVDAHRSPDIRIALSGRPIMEVSEAAVMDRQRAQFGVTFLAILLVLYLAFGQLQGVVIPSATALLSTLWSLGFMGHAGIPLTAWTAGAPMLVVTVAAGHSAQMLKRYYEEFARLGSREAAIVESTSRIGVVMLAAGTTAGAGFAALAILRIPSLTEFGLGVAAGILAAVVLEMTFMLALRTLWPAGRRTRGEGPLSRWLDRPLARFWDAAAHRPRRVIVASVVVVVLAVAGLPRLRTEFVVRDYRSPRTEIGRDMPVFDEHFPDTTTLTVLLEGPPGSMQTPEAMRLMRGLTETMAAVEGVGRTSSLADFIQRTLEVFAPDRAAGGLPEDADLIAQLFFLSDSPAFERYVDRAYSRSVVLGFLGREDSALVRRVIDRLEAYLRAEPPRTIRVSLAGGSGPTILAFNEHTVRGKALNITIVLLVIFALSSLLLRTRWVGRT